MDRTHKTLENGLGSQVELQKMKKTSLEGKEKKIASALIEPIYIRSMAKRINHVLTSSGIVQITYKQLEIVILAPSAVSHTVQEVHPM